VFISDDDFQDLTNAAARPHLVKRSDGFAFELTGEPEPGACDYDAQHDRTVCGGETEEAPRWWEGLKLVRLLMEGPVPEQFARSEKANQVASQFTLDKIRQELGGEDWRQSPLSYAMPGYAFMYSTPWTADETETYVAAMRWIMGRFQTLAAERNFTLHLILPCVDSNFGPGVKMLKEEVCTKTSCVPLCPLEEAFKRRHPDLDLHYPAHGHFNKLGHRLMAFAIAETLSASGR